MEDARTRFAKHLALTLTAEDKELLPEIQAVLAEHKGKCVVQVRYSNTASQAVMNLAVNWCVAPADALLIKLSELLDGDRVQLCY
jgi:DNA polymerase-3 subunit alpha